MADNRSKAPPAQTSTPSPAAAVTPAPQDTAHGGMTPGAVTPVDTTPSVTFEVQFSEASDETKQLARALYDSYVKNSRGLAWDGRKCPAWDALGDAVRSHWCAVALSVGSLRGQAANAEQGALIATNRRLTEELAQLERSLGATDDRRVTLAVREKTKMFESECDKLRGQIAMLEKRLREATAVGK